MKKLALLSLLFVALPHISMAQSVDDDLYFVPKSKKEKKETTVTRTERVTTVTSTKTSKTTLDDTPQEVRFTSSGRFAPADVVLDASGVERDVDAYNRRYSFSLDTTTTTRYVAETEETVESESEWVSDLSSSEGDYEYATRLVRFRSPRVAVPVSSPLYWDLVYTCSPYDWNVYTDGYYAYVSPTWSNPYWWDWHYDPWRWHHGWSWHVGWGTGGWHVGFGWGWHDPWHHHHHHYHGPYWGHYPHHPHHGPVWAGGGGHFGGGWRDGFYYDNRRRVGNRPAMRAQRQEVAPVRASRGNDRGSTVSTRTTGRTVTGRASNNSVRSSSTRGSQIGDVTATTSSGRNNRSTVGRSEGQNTIRSQATTNKRQGNYTRSSSGRNSRSSSSYSTGQSSTRSSSSGNYSSGTNRSSRSSSGNYSSGSSSSRSSSGSFSSGRSSSSRSSAGGSTRSGGGGRSGGRR